MDLHGFDTRGDFVRALGVVEECDSADLEGVEVDEADDGVHGDHVSWDMGWVDWACVLHAVEKPPDVRGCAPVDKGA